MNCGRCGQLITRSGSVWLTPRFVGTHEDEVPTLLCGDCYVRYQNWLRNE